MKEWLIGEAKGMVMFSAFLLVDVSVVSSRLAVELLGALALRKMDPNKLYFFCLLFHLC